MKITIAKTAGEIVAADYRTAAVFQSRGIDFCCKGNRTIGEICETTGVDPDVLIQEIEKTIQASAIPPTDYSDWPCDILVDYIEKKHHRYVSDKTPILMQHLDKICAVHGNQHPELREIRDLFSKSAADLAAHMKKEELILFPFIRKIEQAKRIGKTVVPAPFQTIENPINSMKHEHNSEGEIFNQIRFLSNNYTPPADSCNTYKITYALLHEFEADLHFHIHLENNILFPKSLETETAVIIH